VDIAALCESTRRNGKTRAISGHTMLPATQVNSALHPSGVAKSSSASWGWDKGGKVTAAGWQVTLCDPIWHVISGSGVVILITNCNIRMPTSHGRESTPHL